MNFLICNYYLSEILKTIAKKFNIDPVDLSYYTIEEVKMLIMSGPVVDVTNRRKKSVYIRFFDDEYHADNQQTNEIFDIISKKNKPTELKGFVASAPVDEIEGKIKIMLNTKSNKFEKDNILVTSMTRPEFFPFMKKSKAVITNEGGLTSHAAIVSRELNIPCVIGTKIATKVLKDGDYVHIDLKTGKIKKLR